MKTVKEIIDYLSDDTDAWIPRPATKKDISDCQKDLEELALELLPEGFVNFLMGQNGFAWNGVEFYSTDQVRAADDPDGYCLMDIVTMNDEFNDRFELDEKVLLGRSDEDYFTYNIETLKYEVLEAGSWEAMEEYETFDELFCEVVGGRIGAVSDIGEGDDDE
jgi:hypothetical protein